MKILTSTAVSAAVALVFMSAAAIEAHHTRNTFFDVDSTVTIHATIVRFDPINPHVHLYVDEETAGGRVERWMVEGPPPGILAARGTRQDALIAGATIEVCGYVLKEDGQKPRNITERLLSAELVVMPDGEAHLWGDYGNTLCREQYGLEFPD